MAATGLASERIGATAKAAAWWTLPGRNERTGHVAAAHAAISSQTRWPGQITALECQIIDQAADFGLTQPPPASYAELTAAADGAVLAGRIIAIVGRRLLLDTPAGTLLADMRRVAGWRFTSAPDSGDPPQPSGLAAVPRDRPKADHDDQGSLF